MYSREQFKTPLKDDSENKESSTELKSAKLYSDTNNLTFRYEWGSQQDDVEDPPPPDVWNVLDNVTNFADPSHTVYIGDDVIPDNLMEGIIWKYLQINLTALNVWNDHNPAGPGDIYVRWIPNYWIGLPEYDLNNNWQNYQWIDDLTIDHDLYFETPKYPIEDGTGWYNFSEPITLYEGWTVLSSIIIEVFEYDAVSADDSLGGIYWNFYDPNSIEGYWEFALGDVDIALNISVLDTNNIFTAKNLTELFQPFLCDRDDTVHTAGPNGVFARVIHGYDPAIDTNAFCIQYLYYWSEVWLDDFWSDELIHYDDFELVQIYLNFSYMGGPVAYRFVFDNHDEYTNSSTEWRDSMEYAIYEWNIEETGILAKNVNNSQELQPLLGTNYTAYYEYKNLTAYIEHFSVCYGGVASLILTIETYNHQFAIGRTGDYSGILGQYYIDPYNDTIIYNCYGQLNKSFTLGTHEINGEDIPNYAPFAYDVIQVFEVPYIHSNYDFLMQKAASFQGSIEADGGFIKVDRSVNITYIIPLETNLELPDTLATGDNLTTLLETSLVDSNAILTIDYYFKISANYSVFFVDHYFETEFNNSIVIDFSDPVIQLLCKVLEFVENFQFSIDLVEPYVSIDIILTPQLLGEILNCNITIHIDEILKLIFPEYGWIVGIFFEDIYFKINPIISGYLACDIKLGDFNKTIYWDMTTKNFNIDLEIPDLTYGDNLSLELTNFRYGINFQIGWYIGFEMSWLVKFVFGDIHYEHFFGTWPNSNYDLFPIEGNITLKSWDAYATKWGTTTDGGVASIGGGGGGGGDGEETIPGYNFFILIGTISIISIILIKKQLFYEKPTKK